MRAMHGTGRWGRAIVAAGSLGTLIVTAGCSGAAGAGVPPQGIVPAPQAANQPGLPVVVSCEPGQRTVVRPTIVNGVAMSQVECVAAEASPSIASAQPLVQSPSGQPVATQIAYRAPAPQPVYRPVNSDVADTEVVPVSTRAAVEPVRARQVVPARQTIYDEPRVQRRSVKKSAIIIGSSSGVGAGVGAAVGGKKGALIGAAIGGGGAALWDQMTRRKN
jgi:hypothetical protein